MQALIVLCACLASATAVVDIPAPVKFPKRVGGATARVREVLCPKQIKISGISKRALGCTVEDIFGETDLSPEYIAKLQKWADHISEDTATDPTLYDFKPTVTNDDNVANNSHAGVDKMYDEATHGPGDIDGIEWSDDFFGKGLIPDPVEIPEEYKIFQANTAVKDPTEEMEEEDQAIVDAFERPGWKVTVEIPQEELPWNVQAQPKDIHTRTTTPNPYVAGRNEDIDPSLLPWSEDFKR